MDVAPSEQTAPIDAAAQRVPSKRDEAQPEVLRVAWDRYAVLDRQALRMKRLVEVQRYVILTLGLIGTILGLLRAAYDYQITYLSDPLRLLLLLIPVLLTAIVLAAAWVRYSSKATVLRTGADTVKREIYRYRTGIGPYREEESRRAALAERVTSIIAELVKSNPSLPVLEDYSGDIRSYSFLADDDDGMSPLSLSAPFQ